MCLLAHLWFFSDPDAHTSSLLIINPMWFTTPRHLLSFLLHVVPGRPRAPKDSSSKEEEEEFETPTMSFESFLTYDAPTSVKKKKKPSSSSSSSSHSRPSHSSSSRHTGTPTPMPSSSSSSSSSSKVSKANGTQSTKRPRSGASSAATTPEKRKRVRTRAARVHLYRLLTSLRSWLFQGHGGYSSPFPSVDVNADVHFLQVVEAVPMLPEIPLPAIQPNYRPLPSIDMLTPLSPQRRKGNTLTVSCEQHSFSHSSL